MSRGDLSDLGCCPTFVTEAIREALPAFERSISWLQQG